MKEPLNQLIDILPGDEPSIIHFSNSQIFYFFLTILIVFIYNKFKRDIYLKINLYREIYQLKNNTNQTFIAEVNLFLKLTFDLYHPRDDFASLHTIEWLKYIDDTSNTDFSQFKTYWEKWSYGNDSPTKEQKKIIIKQCKKFLFYIHGKK